MSDCTHQQLFRTSQLGTDGFPIYYCESCRELFKVKPEEITVELPHSVWPKLEDVVQEQPESRFSHMELQKIHGLLCQFKGYMGRQWVSAHAELTECIQRLKEVILADIGTAHSQPVREDKALRELVAKWREKAKRATTTVSYSQALDDCARDVESLLPRESGGAG